jgi:outer membrane lipoprotein carrier protein
MRTLVTALATAVVLTAPARATQAPSAADLVRRIQAHYDTVRDFRADFVQTHKGPLLPQTSVERGQLVVKKVNRLRVSYTTRPKKEFVADGTDFYAHFIEDKFGTITPLPKAGDSSIALLFLAGRGSLLEDFVPSLPAKQPEGKWQVKLTPKTPQPDFDTLTLTVDRGSLKLSGLMTEDDEAGTSTFEFSDLRENTGVADRAFAFKFPAGTYYERHR